MKIGLVLEGGAMRGLYTAGVLDTLMDNGIKADTAIGTSAGVLFGVNYASGQRGRALRYNKKYAPTGSYMGIRSLLTTGNIINKQFAYYDLPSKLDIFDEEAFEASGMDFYATVTNVETGEAEYIRITDCFKQIEVMRATAAMPYVSKIVEYEGKKYLDGGVADSIPVEKCIEMGCDKVIVVLTRPIEYRKGKTKSTAVPTSTTPVWKRSSNWKSRERYSSYVPHAPSKSSTSNAIRTSYRRFMTSERPTVRQRWKN